MPGIVGVTFHFQRLTGWQWVGRHFGYFWQLSVTTLELALVSVALGLAVALPLGVLAVRRPATSAPILGVTTVLYSLPSLAAFAFLVSVTGIGDITVVIPLTTYAVAILVRSVADGLRSVPAEVTTAATAMGYGSWRRLLGVELPVAVPVLLAGLRVATVASISLETVGSLIGVGGLGQLFIAGEDAGFVAEIVSGIVIVALWAAICDLLLVGAGRRLAPWARA